MDGPSGASYGWEELSFKPGLLLQLGVVLDWGATHNILKDAEIGVATNIFFEEIGQTNKDNIIFNDEKISVTELRDLYENWFNNYLSEVS